MTRDLGLEVASDEIARLVDAGMIGALAGRRLRALLHALDGDHPWLAGLAERKLDELDPRRRFAERLVEEVRDG